MILAISRNKDSKAAPPYLSLYRLTQAPFSSLSGRDAFYADPDRTQALDMLQHLTQYSEELLLVTGPDGVGKTSMLEQFLERAEEHWQVCRLDGGNSIEADSLFRHIAECFHLDLSKLSPQELLQGLQSQLSTLQEQQLPVLLIDDAQRLSDDALEIVMHLASLEGEHGKLVRVLLFSDNTIESRLAVERFAGISQPHRLELKGLDEEQTAIYLGQRLLAAGYRGEQLFSDKEIRQIQRQSLGLPGRINDEAHELLMHRMAPKSASTVKTGGRYLKMGLAATAVIGTVLGLHERINSLLGGDERAMTVSSPERPVMRLADGGNPWAVVIRDGESIQINCGASTGDTVGVRPVMAAAAMVEQPLGLSAPMLEDVSPVSVAEGPATPPEKAGEQPPNAGMEETDTPTVEAAQEPAPPPQAVAEQSPLVVKQEAPAENVAVAKAETETAESVVAKAPAELKLMGTTPSPLTGSSETQRIVLNGSGFVEGSKVAVSHAGKVEVLPAASVIYMDDSRIAIDINTGILPVSWAVQVSTPDNRRSNVLRFQVVAPPKTEEAAATKPGEEALAKPEPAKPEPAKPEPAKPEPAKPEPAKPEPAKPEPAKPEPAKPEPAKPEPAKPEPAKPEPAKPEPAKPEPTPPGATAAKKPAVRQTILPTVMGKQPVQGSDWLARQPKQNLTLQLLASSSKEATEQFARQAGLAGPLAHFVMDKAGKELHVLTQGSYSSRTQAETAAKSLPKGMTPWIRNMGSVQQVMKREAKAAAKADVSFPPTGAGIKDTAWVWSQDPGRYTIQLAAAESEQAIEAAMRRIALPGELVVVQTLREGKPWYALIYGSFASKASARGTIDRLPESLRQVGPWPRSFGSLHDEISRSTPAGSAKP